MFWGVIRLFEHSFAIIRIFLFISVVCFIPRFFVTMNKSLPIVLDSSSCSKAHSCSLGVENIKKDFIVELCSGKLDFKLGLIVSNIQDQEPPSLDMLHAKKIEVARVMYIDEYMCNKIFDKSSFNELDILLVDIIDLDFGYNRQVLLLFNIICQAAACGIPIVVLDRPNMMGKKIEGPLYRFEGEHKNITLPVRHGMTAAELAHYYNNQALHCAAKIHAVPMRNYRRLDMNNNITLKAKEIDQRYGSSVCGMLAYVAPIDVGLETAYPYSCILLPQSVAFSEQQWYQLQIILRELGINSALFRYVNQQKNETYRGLRFNIPEIAQVNCFKTVLVILEFFKSAGLRLSFSDAFYTKMGTSLVRQYIKGMISKKKFISSINKELEAFYRTAFGVFMYYPLPQLSLL